MDEKPVSSDDVQKNILKALNKISKRLDVLEDRMDGLEKAEPVPVSEPPEPEKIVAPGPATLEPKALREERTEVEPPTEERIPAAPAPEKPKPKKKKVKAADIEGRLGVVVLTIAVIVIATAMVLFASFLYQYIGPWGKAIIAYAVSGVFVIGGLLIERKVKLFGQALFALGLGLTYFVTFAIYFIEPIQVLYSKTVEIILLTIVVAAITFIADRKKSQFFAGMAIFLGYYTIIVSDVTLYTLIATLLLAVGALAFLIKNRWVTLPWIALVGSYATYIIWVAFKDTGEASITAFWISAGFLIAYFALFALAVIILKGDKLGRVGRLIYGIINMWLFYPLLLYMYIKLAPDYRGYVECAVAGTFVLLAVVHALKSKDDWLFAPYLISGLVLAPIGISIAVPEMWAGLSVLGLVVAVFAASYFFKHRWTYSILQYLLVFLFIWSLYGIFTVDTLQVGSWKEWVYYGSATLSIVAMLAIPLLHRKTFKPKEGDYWDTFEKYTPGFGIVLGSLGLYLWPFPLFGAGNGSFVTVLLAILLVLLGRVGKFIAAEVMGFFALMLCVIWYFVLGSGGSTSDPGAFAGLPIITAWGIGLAIAIAAFIVERILAAKYRGKYYDAVSNVITIAAVLFFVLFLPTYLAREFFSGYVTLAWVAIGAAFFTFGMIAKAHAYRWGSFIILLMAALRLFVSDLPFEGMRETITVLIVSIITVIALFAVPVLHRRLFKPDEKRIFEKIEKYAPGALIAGGWVALFAFFLGPIQKLFGVPLGLILTALSSAWLIFYGRLGKFISTDIVAIINVFVSVIFYFVAVYNRSDFYDTWPLLHLPIVETWVLGLIIFAVAFLVERVLAKRYEGVTSGILSLILTITTVLFFVFYLPTYLAFEFWSNLITLSWAVAGLAFFAYGLIARIRWYRLGGLAMLLASVVRLFIVDLADTPILLRVAAFFVTGLVLLVVAFIYIFNREKMKEWL